jgi:hypothetical protein
VQESDEDRPPQPRPMKRMRASTSADFSESEGDTSETAHDESSARKRVRVSDEVHDIESRETRPIRQSNSSRRRATRTQVNRRHVEKSDEDRPQQTRPMKRVRAPDFSDSEEDTSETAHEESSARKRVRFSDEVHVIESREIRPILKCSKRQRTSFSH